MSSPTESNALQAHKGPQLSSDSILAHTPWNNTVSMLKQRQVPGLTPGGNPQQNLLWMLVGVDCEHMNYPREQCFDNATGEFFFSQSMRELATRCRLSLERVLAFRPPRFSLNHRPPHLVRPQPTLKSSPSQPPIPLKIGILP